MRSGVRGGGAAQPWRILHANTDCALLVFLFSILSSLILWYSTTVHYELFADAAPEIWQQEHGMVWLCTLQILSPRYHPIPT